MGDRRISLDDGIVANADELVKARAPAEEGFVADVDVSSEQYVVCENVTITDDDIMSEMRTGHKEVTRANAGHAIGGGASMDGDVFAQGIVRTKGDA